MASAPLRPWRKRARISRPAKIILAVGRMRRQRPRARRRGSLAGLEPHVLVEAEEAEQNGVDCVRQLLRRLCLPPWRPPSREVLGQDVAREVVEACPAARRGSRVGWRSRFGDERAVERKGVRKTELGACAQASGQHAWAHLLARGGPQARRPDSHAHAPASTGQPAHQGRAHLSTAGCVASLTRQSHAARSSSAQPASAAVGNAASIAASSL